MNNYIKVNYSQLENILKKVGYPESKIMEFRKKYIQSFLSKVSKELENKLSPSQKKDIQQMTQDDNINTAKVLSYFERSSMEKDLKNIIQKISDRTISYTVEKMIKFASPEELVIIKNTLKI